MRTEPLILVENLTKPRAYGVDLFFRASERFELLRMALIDGRWSDDEGPSESSNEATESLVVFLVLRPHQLQGRL